LVPHPEQNFAVRLLKPLPQCLQKFDAIINADADVKEDDDEEE
jgi:hypothetical protein